MLIPHKLKLMKRLFLLLVLNTFLFSHGFSQSSVWKVEGNGNTIYLGGSVHVLRPGDYPLPEEFNVAFNKAEAIVLEADIEKLEDPEIAQSLIVKGIYQGEKNLQNVLSEEVYAKLKVQCSNLSIPIENLAKLKPSLVVLTLTVMKMQQMGISAEGIDKHFYVKSKAENKDILFLETVEEQIELIVNMGEGNEDDFVLKSLKDFESMEKDLSSLMVGWRDGTSKVMKKELKEMKKEFPELYQSLLVQRNNNWMPKIDQYMNDKQVEFIIVGSLHLHGIEGLLKKLKDKGYLVEQLKL